MAGVNAGASAGDTSGSAGVCASSKEVQTQRHNNMGNLGLREGNSLVAGNPYPGPNCCKPHVSSIGVIRQSIHRNGASGNVQAICHDCGNQCRWLEYPTPSANSLHMLILNCCSTASSDPGIAHRRRGNRRWAGWGPGLRSINNLQQISKAGERRLRRLLVELARIGRLDMGIVPNH